MSSAARLLAVLDLFGAGRPDWSVEEAASCLGVPASSMYRTFRELRSSGLLTGAGNGRHALGPTIIRLDWQLRTSDPLVLAAQPELDRIVADRAIPAVAILCRLYEDRVMCVAQAASAEADFAIAYQRGRPMPLFAGSASRVILAGLSPSRLHRLYRDRPEAFAEAGLGEDWDQVRRALRRLAETGSCIAAGEVDPGMRAVSVPLLAPDGTPASLSLVSRASRFPASAAARAVAPLRAHAQRIEQVARTLARSRETAARQPDGNPGPAR